MRLFTSAAASLLTLVAGAKVTELPGIDVSKLPFDMYSGYVTVAPKRHMFYAFTTAEENPDEAPLVIWYTGGPGCSGMDAFFNENGPFQPTADKKLRLRDFRWNRVANIIWVEQPIGVGFSYEEGATEVDASDSQAAEDNFSFVRGFLKEFPQYKGRELWTTGESYGGMYQPTLVRRILLSDDEDLKQMISGMMLGNPVLICESCNIMGQSSHHHQFMRFFYDGLLSYTTYKNWLAAGCAVPFAEQPPSTQATCDSLFKAAKREVGVINQQLAHAGPHEARGPPPQVGADLDPDDLVYDFCTGNGTTDVDYSTPAEECQTLGGISNAILNEPTVQRMLHARAPASGWTVCAGPPQLQYTGDLQSAGLLPVLQEIFKLKPGLAILYYSGDFDVATVPMQFTQACLDELGSTRGEQTLAWSPWRVNGRHAGYVEAYDRYTFASVKAAGHEAPTFQPLLSYAMYTRFLKQQDLKEEGGSAAAPLSLKASAPAVPAKQSDVLNAMKGTAAVGPDGEVVV